MTPGKTIALAIRTLVGKVMSLPFNPLFRFAIAFLPRSSCLLISWLQSGFSVVETEVDIFLGFPCFLYNPANVGNLISSFSSFSKPSLDIWNFLVYIMLKPSMKDFKHGFTSMGDECNCPMVNIFFGTTFLRDWDED